MRFPQLLSAPLFLPFVLLIAGTETGHAAPVRLVSSDARGVTLRVEVPAFEIAPPRADGHSRLVVPGFEVANLPGRPEVPYTSALIAIPPGARPVARVIDAAGEELREGVRLVIAPQPGFRDDGQGLGAVPTLDDVPAVQDGPWPGSAVELDDPFTIRRQRVVEVRLFPVRADEGSARVWVRRTLTVRIDFAGVAPGIPTAPAEDDRSWEPVLRTTVLNYEQGRSWREPVRRDRLSPEQVLQRPGALGAPPFDESAAEVRVRLDTTAVHQLLFDVLNEMGYPNGVPISEVSVHRHEFIENATPSYVTVELPIEVDDADADGVFGSGDRVILFVQNWAERSRATIAQRAWGSGEVVFVTQVPGRAGLRVPTRSGWNGLTLTPLASYPFTQRWEQNTGYLPVFQPGAPFQPAVTDTNTDQFLWVQTGSLVMLYDRPDQFPFETNQLDTTRQVSFTLTWQGSRANNHYLWGTIQNGAGRVTTVADSANYHGRGAFTRSVTLFGSSLTEGATNLLRSYGRNLACSDPGNVECMRVNAVVNWFQATYWRRYRALGGYLACNSGDASGDYEIQADGFPTADIRVYDVTDSLNPVRLTIPGSNIFQSGGRWSVRFQDSAAPGSPRSYVVFDRPKIVPFDRYTRVTRQHLTARTEGDYLLIVPEEFQDAVPNLVAVREALGLRVVVAPLEAVNDEFNGGRRSSYAIKRFIRYGYRNWDTRFVLLVGDGSEDPQNFLGSAGTDYVPAQKVLAAVTVYDGFSNTAESIVSDGWYGWCVEMNCTYSSTQRRIPDVFVGRLPVNSLQEATDVVDKIVKYETLLPDQSWRRDMLLASDDIYSTTSFFGGGNPGDFNYCQRDYESVFMEITQIIQNVIRNDAGLVQSNAEIFNLNYLLFNEQRAPGDTTCRLSWGDTQQHTHLSVTPQLFEKLNAGRLWWNYQGHANPGVLTHEDLYVNRGRDSNDDKDNFLNTDKPFLFSAFSCHPNMFGRVNENDPSVGPSLGEDMVNLPGRGAIASWGSTGYEILPSSASSHLNVYFARALFAHPPVDTARLGRWDGRVLLGAAIAKTLIDNRTLFSFERDVGISYSLLGDPATRISVGPSQFAVAANGVPVVSGEPVRLHTPGDSVRFEVDVASNTRIDSVWVERIGATTEIIPATAYTVTPGFPDTSSGGTGGRRYHVSYRTTLDVGSFRYVVHTLDHNGLPGQFDIVFQFITVLRADGVPIGNDDAIAPGAHLSLLVVSPAPIDPPADLQLTLDGTPQTFTAARAPGDSSGREWVLSPVLPGGLAPGGHRLELTAGTEVSVVHRFRVDPTVRIERALAFPNPFDDDLGSHFSFNLVSAGPVNVQLRIFTVSGRLIYERTEHDLLPGYHQIPWDGRDAEQDKLANGVYLYRLLVRGSGGSAMHEGRLVKLRRPIRKTVGAE